MFTEMYNSHSTGPFPNLLFPFRYGYLSVHKVSFLNSVRLLDCVKRFEKRMENISLDY